MFILVFVLSLIITYGQHIRKAQLKAGFFVCVGGDERLRTPVAGV